MTTTTTRPLHTPTTLVGTPLSSWAMASRKQKRSAQSECTHPPMVQGIGAFCFNGVVPVPPSVNSRGAGAGHGWQQGHPNVDGGNDRITLRISSPQCRREGAGCPVLIKTGASPLTPTAAHTK